MRASRGPLASGALQENARVPPGFLEREMRRLVEGDEARTNRQRFDRWEEDRQLLRPCRGSRFDLSPPVFATVENVNSRVRSDSSDAYDSEHLLRPR